MTFEELKSRVMLNKTPLLIIFLVITTVVLVALALTTNKGALPTPDKLTTEEDMAETVLSLSEVYDSEDEATQSSSMKTDVEINTGKNKVTGVQLEIKYNPVLLTSIEIVPGDFFSNPSILIERIDTTEGVISYALGSGEEGIMGEGIVATISFSPRGIARGETSFEFLSKTAVSAEDFDTSVLREMSGIEFTLEPENTTSPSAQPTITQ